MEGTGLIPDLVGHAPVGDGAEAGEGLPNFVVGKAFFNGIINRQYPFS